MFSQTFIKTNQLNAAERTQRVAAGSIAIARHYPMFADLIPLEVMQTDCIGKILLGITPSTEDFKELAEASQMYVFEQFATEVACSI